MKQEKWIEQLRDKLADYEMEAPEGLWDDIEAALPEQPQKPALMIALRRWVIAASLLALLATGGYWWFSNSSTPRQTQLSHKSQPSQETQSSEEPRFPQDDQSPLAPQLPLPSSEPPRNETLLALETSEPAVETPQENHQDIPAVETVPAPEETPQDEQTPRSEQSVLQQLDRQIAQIHSRDVKAPTVSLYAMNGFRHQTRSNGVVMSDDLAQNFVNPADYQGQMARRRETIYLAGYEERQKHYQPVSFGLTVSYPLSRRLSLSTGLVFTHLQSDFVSIMRSQQISRKQQLDYIGLPLTVDLRMWSSGDLKTYLSAGIMADWNVRSSLQTKGLDQHLDKDRMQWSASGALGVQYDILPQLGLYAEPGIRHYFDNGSRLQNFFKDKPTNFNLQFGVRWNFR